MCRYKYDLTHMIPKAEFACERGEMRGRSTLRPFDAECGADRGDAPPDRGSAAPRRVEVAVVDGALNDQVAHAVDAILALPGCDGNASGEAHVAQPALVVVPAHGFLEPLQF